MKLDIKVNGDPVNVEFDGPVVWEELLQELGRELGTQGWCVGEILVNGEAVSDPKADPFAADPDGSYSVAVSALPEDSTVASVVEQLWESLPRFKEAGEEIAADLGRGDWRSGLETLTPFLEDLQLVLTGFQLAGAAAQQELPDLPQRVQKCLGEVTEYIERQSWVELSDLLLYELVPLLEQWHGTRTG